jgi:DNA-directed RNA polymerase subunit L
MTHPAQVRVSLDENCEVTDTPALEAQIAELKEQCEEFRRNLTHKV